MKSNAELTEEYFDTSLALNGDIEGRRAAYAYMQGSTAIVHHKVVACSFIPRLFNDESWSTLKTIAETISTFFNFIFCLVMSELKVLKPSLRNAPHSYL